MIILAALAIAYAIDIDFDFTDDTHLAYTEREKWVWRQSGDDIERRLTFLHTQIEDKILPPPGKPSEIVAKAVWREGTLQYEDPVDSFRTRMDRVVMGLTQGPGPDIHYGKRDLWAGDFTWKGRTEFRYRDEEVSWTGAYQATDKGFRATLQAPQTRMPGGETPVNIAIKLSAVRS